MVKSKKKADNHPNWLDRDRDVDDATTVHFSFNGKDLVGRKGESVAAALIGKGIQSFRQSRTGQARGLYCGMGTCFECLVTIDGHLSQRACLVSLKEGMRVVSQAYAPMIDSIKDTAPLHRSENCAFPNSVELAVIGAGPGGLAGAISAARAGVDVAIFDERALPGGQYFKQPAIHSKLVQKNALDKQSIEGKSLIAVARSLNVAIYSEAMIWNIVKKQDTFELKIVRNNESHHIIAKQIIVATGAYEKPFPIAGWTLPGFMTTGAVQTLIRAYRVTPGSKVLICGNGPLNLQVAAELVKEGVEVAAVIEVARPHKLSNLSALVKATFRAPILMLKGLTYIARLWAAKVPILYNHVLVSAEGDDFVENAHAVAINQNGKPIAGTDKKFEVDTVCVGYGFIPNTDLTRLLRCNHGYKEDKGNLVIDREHDGVTSCSGVFSVGDAGQVLGAQFAMDQGTLAGISVAKNLGKKVFDSHEIKLAKRNIHSHQEFQRALWTLYDCPEFSTVLSSNVESTICRCEDVKASEVMNAIKCGADDIASVKKMTRVGMGRCQGRYCGPTVIKMLSSQGRTKIDEFAWFAPQAPLKPLLVKNIAQMKNEWGSEMEGFETSRLMKTSTTIAQNSVLSEAQVVVIGAGILGTSAAYSLASRGTDVILLDRGEPNGEASGNNAGSLHVQLLAYDFSLGSTGQISPACQVLPLQKESTRLWCELEKELAKDLGIQISGGLMVAENKDQMQRLKHKVEMERSLGIEVDLVSQNELRDRAPYISEGMIGGAWCPEEGKINPMYATPALLNAGLSRGIRLHKQTNVLGIRKSSSYFEIETSKGTIKAGQIVNAAGGWSALVAEMVGITLPARPHPIQMIVTEPVTKMVDQLLAYADRHLTLKQVPNGNFIIGGGWRAGLDQTTGRPVVLQESFEGNLWVASQVIPQLNMIQVIRSWAAMNVSVDGAPILGESKEVPGFYNLVSVNGVTLGPLLGELTAEVVCTQKKVPGISRFTLERFN